MLCAIVGTGYRRWKKPRATATAKVVSKEPMETQSMRVFVHRSKQGPLYSQSLEHSTNSVAIGFCTNPCQCTVGLAHGI